MKRTKTIIKWLIGTSLILAGLAAIIIFFYPSTEESQELQEIQKLAKVNATADGGAAIDFDALKAVNPDIIAWIRVEGTDISYPVMQSSKDKPEDYYLHHDFYCRESIYGCIYIQKRNSSDFSDFDTVIYGHNMRNGSMFRQLHYFREKDFFSKNKNITIYLPDGSAKHYEIFAAYKAEADLILHDYGDFKQDNMKENYIADITSGTTHPDNHRDVKLSIKDHLITLSTCIGDENYRLLIQAKKAG